MPDALDGADGGNDSALPHDGQKPRVT